MLVVVGSRHDKAACEIVAQWARHDAALLSCEDLSRPGWRHWLGNSSSSSRAVVAGQVVRESDIRGVLVRRPWIIEQELTYIATADREYVAAEMNAFLLSWLANLSCRVLNPPQGTSLCGPNWRPVQWAKAAACAGLPINTFHWRVPALQKRSARGPSDALAEVTVVGESCIGAPDANYGAGAKRLASIAKVGLLSVWFKRAAQTPRFVSASVMPSLKDPEVSQAVCDYLLTTGESA